ncbi:MAG: MFS transporter [Opitutia bacterium]|nr:MFS transporter [Opitutaceae bacterium]PHX84928.1 MAG: MFS transporter [Opitutae bacterium]
MSAPAALAEHHALSPRRESATLIALAAVQFTHVLDFMIMLPLGPQLMRALNLTPAQFTHLVAAYGLAAALSGFAGGFFLDRIDRKRALVFVYAGFGLATLACALAPTHSALLAARLIAGAFGGISGSLVTAMIGDIIPPTRRGRAMSYVMSAFPLASVLGVPLGLTLAGWFDWHAPFYLLAGCSAFILALALFALPNIRTAIKNHQPIRQMRDIVTSGIHLRAFAVTCFLVMAGGCIIPFLAPSFVINYGLAESDLPKLYAIGGIAAFISATIVGRLSDRLDRLHLLAGITFFAAVVVLILTNLETATFPVAAALMASFMVTMSSRFAPAMAMVTDAVSPRYRGGFMSVNSALQQASGGLANLLAGVFITTGAGGRLVGFPALGIASVGFFGLTLFCAAHLKAAAPHVARAAKKSAPPPLADPAT